MKDLKTGLANFPFQYEVYRQMDVETFREAVSQLLVYRPLADSTLLREFVAFLGEPAENYPRFFAVLAENALDRPQVTGNLWQDACFMNS